MSDILERLKEHIHFHEEIFSHKADAAFLRIVSTEVEKLLEENKKMREALDTLQKVAMIRCDHDTVVLTGKVLDS